MIRCIILRLRFLFQLSSTAPLLDSWLFSLFKSPQKPIQIKPSWSSRFNLVTSVQRTRSVFKALFAPTLLNRTRSLQTSTSCTRPLTYDMPFLAGLLTSKWSLRLWGEESVSLESWVQNGKPKTSEDKHRAQVVEDNLFEVRPRGGLLGPGESCHVSIEYQPGSPGTHRLPALLEISRGRRALLTLVGRTLEFHEKHLIVSENPFQLGGVVLGEQRPFLRGLTLRNGGPSDIRYQLDTEPLKRLTQANYGFEVLTVRNPEGCIPVGESVQLEWLFQPIEECEYEAELPLVIWGAGTTWIKVRGRGIQPESLTLAETPGLDLEFGYNPRQTLTLPNQRATLSVESISFGHLPELSISRRLVIVRNRSSEAVRFSWRPSLAADSLACGRVKVEARRGIIAGGGECVCKAVMTAGTHPAIFEVRENFDMHFMFSTFLSKWPQ